MQRDRGGEWQTREKLTWVCGMVGVRGAERGDANGPRKMEKAEGREKRPQEQSRFVDQVGWGGWGTGGAGGIHGQRGMDGAAGLQGRAGRSSWTEGKLALLGGLWQQGQASAMCEQWSVRCGYRHTSVSISLVWGTSMHISGGSPQPDVSTEPYCYRSSSWLS